MKFFYKKFCAAFLFLFFAFNAKAVNDTLTIGQVFNLSVGDAFKYIEYEMEQYRPHPLAPLMWRTVYGNSYEFTILSRMDLNDTIIYVREQQYHGIDTLIITALDSPVSKFSARALLSPFIYCGWLAFIGTCDSPNVNYCHIRNYIDSNFYDRQTEDVSHTLFEAGESITYSENTGFVGAGYGGVYYLNGEPGSCGVQLIYYHSDSITWIDSSYYFPNSISEPSPSPSFSLSPNPATDEINITREADNHAPYDVYIYDIAGKCVLAHKNISNNMENINVISFPPGYYLLKLTDEHSFSASRGFIIAR